jgi:hypothetical protein
MALEERSKALADELQRMEIISRDKYQRDEISRLIDAQDEGEARRMAKGRVETQEQIALAMLEDGMDPDKIFRLTGVKLA